MSPRISPEEVAQEVTDIMREAVTAARVTLGSMKQALPDVARRYGLTESRVKSYWWSRVTTLTAQEYKTILAAYRRDLALREVRQAHALEMTRATLVAQQKDDPVRGGAGVASAAGLRGWASAVAGAGASGGPAQGLLPLTFGPGRR